MSNTTTIKSIKARVRDLVAAFETTYCNRKGSLFATLTIYVLFSPVTSSAGIFGGALCTAYNSIFDSELKTAISLGAMAIAILVWILDDSSSKIKLWILRIVCGTLVLFNLPVIWGTVISQASIC